MTIKYPQPTPTPTPPIQIKTPDNTKKPILTPDATPSKPWLIPADVQAKNEEMIKNLASVIQPYARAFLVAANDAGYALFITWGYRKREQEQAFIDYAKAMGWPNPEQYGSPEHGKHLTGMAFDVMFWDPSLEGIWHELTR